MKIVLMGATGNAGTPAIKSLVAKGVRPTAAVRDIEKAKGKLGEEVDFVYFDYHDPTTYATALEGVDRLFFIAPPPAKDPEVVKEIVKVAKNKGVELVLFQSGRTSGRIPGKPLYQIERDLEASELNVCIIQPCWFMQNYHTWMGTHLEEGELPMPCGEGKVAFIDTKDLGAAIAEILTGEGHAGKTYELTGAEALSNYDTATIFSEVTGREVAYNDVSLDDYVRKVAEKGWGEDTAKYVAALFEKVRKGSEADVSSDLETLLGRKPRTFREFALDEFGSN